ncbi:hypothetical protein [Plantactinospora endophytica]|uniref:hypothetical protein n=1 Tax=Plantactinospora endophytica TaxID=673535 RepID=UPI00194063DC|nr:hypothetical protein [Plantactinospora endophytica]
MLIPVMALALAPGVRDGYQQYSRAEDRQPVTAGADGWVSFSGARIRLVEVVETTVPGYGNRPFTLPPGVRAWRATLAIELSGPEALLGCRPQLEDRDGRLFSADPAELFNARVPRTGCRPDDETQRSFEAVAYFVLPRSATPVALRITQASAMPRYAQFPIG